MADAASVPGLASATSSETRPLRHSALVRITHWIATIGFFALLFSGLEILISHPRFYWGEAGNVLTPPLFSLPIPASRSSVPTGYPFVLPDQNGWSRDLHFEAGWVVVLTGLVYVASGLFTRHFRKHLVPTGSDLRWAALSKTMANHLHFSRSVAAEVWSYNSLQRLTYLFVIFIVFPLMILTGLAMSPAVTAVFPAIVTGLGGQQTARTIHFFGTVFLVVFLLVHIVMVCRAGFIARTRAMFTGRIVGPKEQA